MNGTDQPGRPDPYGAPDASGYREQEVKRGVLVGRTSETPGRMCRWQPESALERVSQDLPIPPFA